MKLTKNDLNEFNKLYEKMQKNIEIATFYEDVLANSQQIALHYETNLSFFDNLKKLFALNNDFLNYFKDYQLENNFKCLDEKEYLNNPYVKNIKIANVSYLNYYFDLESFKPYECFIYDEIKVIDDIEVTKLGYFKNKFNYLTLKENEDLWMLITPHEINTIEKALNKASGQILTLGLGLGYFAYMASLKDNITSITIIEKDPNIINLFKQYIEPFFEYKDKIKIINDDAFNYLKNNSLKEFDYLFIDLYKDEKDGLEIYVKMLQILNEKVFYNFDFWIENSLIIMLQRCLINAIYEIINNIVIDNENNIYYDYLIEQFKKALKKQNIPNFATLKAYLTKENIIKLVLDNDF